MAQQHVHHQAGLLVDVLGQGGEGRLGDLRQGQVVEAQNGDVLRHPEALGAEQLHQLGGDPVRCAEDGGGRARLPQELRQLPGVFRRNGLGQDEAVLQGDAVGGQPCPEALQPVLIHIAVLQAVAQEGHAPVTHPRQIIPGHLTAGIVVHAHVVHPGDAEVAVGQHGGDGLQGVDVLQVAAEGAAEDGARHVPAPQIRLHVPVIVGEADQGIIAAAVQLHGQRAHVFRGIGVAEDVLVLAGLDDHRHHMALPLGQGAGRLVGHITGLADQRLDALHGVGGDAVELAVDDVGYRGHADPGGLGDFLERGHARSSTSPGAVGLRRAFFPYYTITEQDWQWRNG